MKYPGLFGDEYRRKIDPETMSWDRLIDFAEEAFGRADADERAKALAQAAEEARAYFPFRGTPVDHTSWSGWPRTGIDLAGVEMVYGMPTTVYQTYQTFTGLILAGLAPSGIDPMLAELFRGFVGEFLDQGVPAETAATRH